MSANRKQFLWRKTDLSYSCFIVLQKFNFTKRGPGSSVGIVTAYGLDGPGNESRWG